MESFAPWVAATSTAAPCPPLQTPPPFSVRCRLPRTFLWMNRLLAGEHFHKLRDPLSACFRPFGIVHPVDDRVAIGAIQGLEETLGGFVRRKCSRQVFWSLRFPLRGICRLPSPIRFRRLNLSKTGGAEGGLAPGVDPQPLGSLRTSDFPDGAESCGRENTGRQTCRAARRSNPNKAPLRSRPPC